MRATQTFPRSLSHELTRISRIWQESIYACLRFGILAFSPRPCCPSTGSGLNVRPYHPVGGHGSLYSSTLSSRLRGRQPGAERSQIQRRLRFLGCAPIRQAEGKRNDRHSHGLAKPHPRRHDMTNHLVVARPNCSTETRKPFTSSLSRLQCSPKVSGEAVSP